MHFKGRTHERIAFLRERLLIFWCVKVFRLHEK